MSMYHLSKHSIPGQVNSVDTRANYNAGRAAHALATVTNANGYEAARLATSGLKPQVDLKSTPEQTKSGRETDTDLKTHNPLNSTECQAGVVYSLGDFSTPISVSQNDTDCLRTDGELAADVELCRIAIGLRQSAQLRLWIIGLEHTRQTGLNYLDRNQFVALLERYGIKYTRHNLNRWLRAGQGVYWRLTTYGRIYLVSYEKLAIELVQKAHEFKLYDLVSTNTPGQRRAMYINVQSSNLQQFEAQCYAAWHASKNNPTISRFILTRLWNKNERSLRRLEKLAGVTVIRNTVETNDPSKVPLKPDGNLRGDVKTTPQPNGHTLYTFNMPNTYQTGMIKQHHRRGASRRVSYLVRNLLLSEALAGTTEQGLNSPGELCHSGRLYCETDKRAKLTRRRGNTNTLYVPEKPGEGRGVVWSIYSVR